MTDKPAIPNRTTTSTDRDVAAFQERAATYEQGWLGRLHHDIADRAADLTLSTRPDLRRVLDIGYGTGYLLRSLASRSPGVDREREVVCAWAFSPSPPFAPAIRATVPVSQTYRSRDTLVP